MNQLKTTIIMDHDGHSADSHTDIGDGRRHLDVLLGSGVIREADEEDRKRLASRKSVSMGHGATWGDGEYLLGKADKLYVLDSEYNLGHLALAIKRLYKQDIERKRQSLYAKLDAAGEVTE